MFGFPGNYYSGNTKETSLLRKSANYKQFVITIVLFSVARLIWWSSDRNVPPDSSVAGNGHGGASDPSVEPQA